MTFRQYDSLWVFHVVARHGSFVSATEKLNLSKGAISYQIRTLEEALGFQVFRRLPRGIVLTAEGHALCDTANQIFRMAESKISSLQSVENGTVTVGLSTYLASRWLSPRLTDFMLAYPGVRLRIQPMIDLMDVRNEDIDLVIRWGDGRWNDLRIERLFTCPAFPTGAPATLERVKAVGLEQAFTSLTLLEDRDDSDAWADWYNAAGLPYESRTSGLTIPDPNVRVQAVMDGQGVALNDAFVTPELRDGRLVRLSDVQLTEYGYYLAYKPEALRDRSVAVFADWLSQQSPA